MAGLPAAECMLSRTDVNCQRMGGARVSTCRRDAAETAAAALLDYKYSIPQITTPVTDTYSHNGSVIFAIRRCLATCVLQFHPR